MTVPALAGFSVLALVTLVPVWWTWQFVCFYARHARRAAAADGPHPEVTVVLSLRGADPSLPRCLDGLLHQDYPRYTVRIVVDSREDPAWAVVQDRLARGHDGRVNVHVEVLRRRRQTCSLKVSSQLQALDRLDPATEVVVFLDADAVPAPDWLRAMTAPFADPGVGAATGVRWFAPRADHWGSLCRHLYNAGSFPQMFAFGIAWGGSLAVRADLLRRPDLRAVWARSFCEDSSISGPLRALGLALAFVPAATQINRESIPLGACCNFLVRQLLCVRLDHVRWPLVLACNVANAVAVTGVAAVLAVALARGAWAWAWASVAVLGVYAAGQALGLQLGERLIRRGLAARGLEPPPPVSSWKLLPAALLAQLLVMYCLARVVWLRRVAWRGAAYRIDGPGRIRLEGYRPFSQPAAPPRPEYSVV